MLYFSSHSQWTWYTTACCVAQQARLSWLGTITLHNMLFRYGIWQWFLYAAPLSSHQIKSEHVLLQHTLFNSGTICHDISNQRKGAFFFFSHCHRCRRAMSGRDSIHEILSGNQVTFINFIWCNAWPYILPRTPSSHTMCLVVPNAPFVRLVKRALCAV